MILLRLFGLWVVLFAIIALSVDITRSFITNDVIITSMGEQWYEISPKSLESFQTFIEGYLHPFLWNPIVFTILTWPSWIVLTVLGAGIYWVARKRIATSVYSN